MFFHGVGPLFVVVLLQEICAAPILEDAVKEEMTDEDPLFKCLGKFGFPKGSEERLFRVVRCSEEHPIEVNCSPEMLDKIANFTQEFPHPQSLDLPEDFSYFYSSFDAMWTIVTQNQSLLTNYSEGGICWDVPAMQKIVDEFEFLNSFYVWTSYYATPIILAEVIFGLVANAVVLTIIFKFKEMRTQPNMIILNLVIADTLLLLSFTVMSYVVYLLPVTIVLRRLCSTLIYALTFNSTCSVYSMVALSFLRYIAICAEPGTKTRRIIKKYVKIPVVILVVWLTSSLVSIPYMLDINENCAVQFTPVLQILDFVLFCLLPVVLVAMFSCITRRRLKRSIKEMPGNKGPGTECEIWARERGANVILALCIVFMLTFFPPTLVTLISTVTTIRYNYASYSHEMLFLLNTCVDPLALFISSSAFRKHFKLLLPNWLVKKT